MGQPLLCVMMTTAFLADSPYSSCVAPDSSVNVKSATRSPGTSAPADPARDISTHDSSMRLRMFTAATGITLLSGRFSPDLRLQSYFGSESRRTAFHPRSVDPK